MLDYLKQILTAQFEASLCMMNDCIDKCPPEHWGGIIGKYPFWSVAYHALCFVDLYLSPSPKDFPMRTIHPAGWDEFNNEHPSREFNKPETSDYLATCRAKAVATIATETPDSLQALCGFDWLKFSRGELYLYNIRHLQHHTGQLSAYLRRIDPTLQDPKAVRWISTGWK